MSHLSVPLLLGSYALALATMLALEIGGRRHRRTRRTRDSAAGAQVDAGARG